MNCHLLRAPSRVTENRQIYRQAVGVKSDGVSKVDRKYSSGYRKEGGRERTKGEEGASESNKAERQE